MDLEHENIANDCDSACGSLWEFSFGVYQWPSDRVYVWCGSLEEALNEAADWLRSEGKNEYLIDEDEIVEAFQADEGMDPNDSDEAMDAYVDYAADYGDWASDGYITKEWRVREVEDDDEIDAVKRISKARCRGAEILAYQRDDEEEGIQFDGLRAGWPRKRQRRVEWLNKYPQIEGYGLEGTGGGNTALVRYLPDHHVLITNEDGMSPWPDDETIVVGLYEGGEDVDCIGCTAPVEDWYVDLDDFDSAKSRDEQLGAVLDEIDARYGVARAGIEFTGLKGFPDEQGWRAVGEIGDTNATEYGGGVIYKHPQGHYFVLYTHGLEGEEISDDEDEWDHEMELYSVHLPDTGAELLKDMDWADLDAVATSMGMTKDELIDDVRSAKNDDLGAKWMATFVADVAGHYGWHELDHYPERYPAREIADMLSEEAPEEEEEEDEGEGIVFQGRPR